MGVFSDSFGVVGDDRGVTLLDDDDTPLNGFPSGNGF